MPCFVRRSVAARPHVEITSMGSVQDPKSVRALCGVRASRELATPPLSVLHTATTQTVVVSPSFPPGRAWAMRTRDPSAVAVCW